MVLLRWMVHISPIISHSLTVAVLFPHSLDKSLKKTEKKPTIQGRWTDESEEFKDALKTLEFKQKSPLIKKLRRDISEYLFMLETQKKYSGMLIVEHST